MVSWVFMQAFTILKIFYFIFFIAFIATSDVASEYTWNESKVT